jgi:threonylcarbamoyladenosine tRNA methylthiotransferase MtaB
MPSFYIEQFGCRATQADGAALERQLRERGYTIASESGAADVVVMNTCTVTAAADAQARDAIRKLHARSPETRIIVTGCYAQRAPEEIAALAGVSWVVGNSHKPEIPAVVDMLRAQAPGASNGGFVPLESLGETEAESATAMSPQDAPAKILTGDILQRSAFLAAPVLGGEGHHTRPTVKIQDGCNSRCSYCVIPFVRGKSRSLAPEKVIEEIQQLSAAGYREVVLSGINLGTYGRDLEPRVEFEDLLRRILDETAVERLRVSSIEPLDVTSDLVALFAASRRIAQHFHMPLQSGCDRILAAMHRWYRAEHYARRVVLIHEQLPNAAIGADVIAGFPGETEGDHAATLRFIENLPFTYLHVFSFSKRPGTRAGTMTNDVAPAVIKRRARELRGLGEAKAAEFRRSHVGRNVRGLTLHRGGNTPDGFTPALSSNYLQVDVRGEYASNLWVDVLTSADNGNQLVGEIVGQCGPAQASKMTCASA